MVEPGAPIDGPAVYRSFAFAFAVWATHFAVAYGAALVFPGEAIARWIAGGALVVTLAVLIVAFRRYRARGGRFSLAAAGLAIGAIVLGTLPAIVG